MKAIVTLVLIVIAFGVGVWYANEYDFALPVLNDTGTTPTSTPQTPEKNTPSATYYNADSDKIQVTTPLPGATVSSAFVVTGRARGGWYFEANFPLEVRSATGTVLVQSPVQAGGEWMTSNFVPFSVPVTVPTWYKGEATLILHKDNASGLPEHDASMSVPIVIN